ncbi:unnamed protein product [Blepharisma stoltei]|uniref:Uncharacterized protein n=1 Tax=Blepharisma stoltei TaxID=1481888 RepID=A0AAU9IIP5_9CILI|nr:unnamed protein product [Blepharisma stoltei]
MWILLITLGLASASLEATPQYPLWPNVFTQTFNETLYYPEFGNQTTTGTYYYDWTNQMYRIDRANGRFDRYCGLVGFRVLTNAPCSHIVVGGNRFLYYPNDGTCCFCCNAAQGCGMLKPTWLDNATFIDTEVHMGVQAYKWNKQGLQNNFYFETAVASPSSRVMLGIYQEPNDLMDFHKITYSVPSGIFDLPKTCSLKTVCPEISTCTAVRNASN